MTGVNQDLVNSMRYDFSTEADGYPLSVGGFQNWARSKYPQARAIEVCEAALDFPTRDPFLPSSVLLHFVGRLLQSRESVNICADSCYRWLADTIKFYCPAAKVYSPKSPCKNWSDSLYPDSYDRVDDLSAFELDAVAIVDYVYCEDDTTSYYPDQPDRRGRYSEGVLSTSAEPVLDMAKRLTNDGVFVWVDLLHDAGYDKHLEASGYIVETDELVTQLADQAGLNIVAAFESSIRLGDYDEPAFDSASALVYVFEKTTLNGPIPLFEILDNDEIETALNSYRDRKPPYMYLGKTCPGANAIRAKKELKRLVESNQMRFVPWHDVFEPFDIERTPEEGEHVVLVPRNGRGPIGFQIRDGYSREYFQAFFDSSSIADLYIKSLSLGRDRPRIFVEQFEESKIPVPSAPEVQQRIIDAHLAIRKAKTGIDEYVKELQSIADRLTEFEAGLVENPTTPIQLISVAEKLTTRIEPTESWAKSLPLPLASILMPYSIDRTLSTESRCERLLCFFESLTAWLATVAISAIRVSPSMWSEFKSTLLKQSEYAAISRELTFGSWRTLLEIAIAILTERKRAKKNNAPVRPLAKQESDTSLSLFDWRQFLPASLTPVFAVANRLRNEWKGHDGLVIDETVASERLRKLEDLLEQTHSILGHSLSKIPLIIPGKGSQTREGYVASIEILQGAAAPFPRREQLINGRLPLEGERYLLVEENSTTIPLIPLVVLEQGAEPKVYYYSRSVDSGFQFVSHHNPVSPNKTYLKSELKIFEEFLDSIAAKDSE